MKIDKKILSFCSFLLLGCSRMSTMHQEPLLHGITELYYVTGNPAKYEEAVAFFVKYLPHITLKQCDIDLQEIQTLDQKAIALAKARQAWDYLKKPVLVDDTGVYFDSYENFPGTMTKFIYKTLGLKGLFKLLETGERMSIRIVLVCMYDENEYSVIEEIINGTFDKTHRLDLHRTEAPFDTVFIPDGVDETVEELRFNGKAEPFQYRMRALKKFVGLGI